MTTGAIPDPIEREVRRIVMLIARDGSARYEPSNYVRRLMELIERSKHDTQ